MAHKKAHIGFTEAAMEDCEYTCFWCAKRKMLILFIIFGSLIRTKKVLRRRQCRKSMYSARTLDDDQFERNSLIIYILSDHVVVFVAQLTGRIILAHDALDDDISLPLV